MSILSGVAVGERTCVQAACFLVLLSHRSGPIVKSPAPENSVRPPRTQAERTARTRAALIGAARALFAERGYAGAGREEIVERAGVTRGAMYHHFASKDA